MSWPALHPDTWELLVAIAWGACWAIAVLAVVVLLLAVRARSARWGAAALVVAVLAGSATWPLARERESVAVLLACRHNLLDLQHALDAAARKKAPADLAELVPLYLAAVPTCPSAGTDTYSASYRRAGAAFTVWCAGSHHRAGWRQLADYPQYRAADGLVPALDE